VLYECALTISSTALDEIFQQMLAKLEMYVPAEQAKDLAKSLNLSGNDLPDFSEIQLSKLCQMWIEKTGHECTPEALVEALVCTKGLGKYASGIGGNSWILIVRLHSQYINCKIMSLHFQIPTFFMISSNQSS